MVGLSSDDVNLNDNELFPTAKGKPQPGDPGQNVFSREQLPVRNLQSRADKSIEHDIEDIEWPQDVKLDRVIESAWAILRSWYGEATDTDFDVGLPVSKIEQLLGLAIVTVCVAVEGDMTLSALQIQIMLPELARSPTTQRIGEKADLGWQSQSLLMVQSAAEADEAPVFDEGIELNTYAIALHCEVKDTSLLSKMAFDSTVLSEQVALRVVDHFGHILRQICRADMISTKISDLDAMTAEDLR